MTSGPDDVALEFDLAMLIPDNRQRIETLVISAPGAAGDGLTLTPDDLNIWNWKQSNGNWYTFVFASDLQIPGPFVPVDGIWGSASSSTTQIDGKESAGSLSRYLPATVDQSVLAGSRQPRRRPSCGQATRRGGPLTDQSIRGRDSNIERAARVSRARRRSASTPGARQ